MGPRDTEGVPAYRNAASEASNPQYSRKRMSPSLLADIRAWLQKRRNILMLTHRGDGQAPGIHAH